MSATISVLVVEDSLVVRTLLTHILEEDARFTIAGAVSSAEDALAFLERHRVDVISLDIRLPGMNGLDATLRIMERFPTPIVVVAAQVDDDELNIAMNALKAGALAVVEKPVGLGHDDFLAVSRRLRTQLSIMSQVKVVRQGIRRGLSFGSVARSQGDVPVPPDPGEGGAVFGALAIAASTGGPQALVRLLSEIGRGYPLPILLVQHITPSFLEGFVTWLARSTGLDVSVAQDGQAPISGHVHVAPADRHLVLRNGRLALSSSSPVSGQKPSATELFRSLAESGKAIGVLLTGMGEDGAEGLRDLRRAGGYTIAEDASTCVVFGMPQAAARMDAVREMLPLDHIAGRLKELATG